MSQKYSQDEAQALVKALKEGNQLAFSIVYKTYAAQTFSLAFKYLLNKELAEDAVQNLFLKLWLKKEEIDETKPINRYLFTMLKNDLLNTLRDSKKNIYLLEDCLSMVLELEDNSQNENLKHDVVLSLFADMERSFELTRFNVVCIILFCNSVYY